MLRLSFTRTTPDPQTQSGRPDTLATLSCPPPDKALLQKLSDDLPVLTACLSVLGLERTLSTTQAPMLWASDC